MEQKGAKEAKGRGKIWDEPLPNLLIRLVHGNFASLAIFCKNLSWFSAPGEGRFGTEGSKGSKEREIWGEPLPNSLFRLAHGDFASLATFCKNLSWFSASGGESFGTEGSKGSKVPPSTTPVCSDSKTAWVSVM